MAAVNLYLFYGNDDYLKKAAAQKIIATALPKGEKDLGLDRIDCACESADAAKAAISKVLEACYTESFLGADGNHVVWAMDCTFLPGGKARAEGQETQASLKTLLDTLTQSPLPEDYFLIFTTDAVNKASAFYKFFASKGTVQECGAAVKPWEESKLAKDRVLELIKETGLTMDSMAANAFSQRVGSDARTIQSELSKLRSYKNDDTRVTLDDIDAITSRATGAEPFALRDAICERNPAALVKAISLLRLAKDQEFPTVNSVIAVISDLLFLSDALSKGWLTAAGWTPEAPMAIIPSKIATLHGYMLTKNITYAKKFTLAELRFARHYALQIRDQLVSTTLQDPWDYIEINLLRMIAKPTRKTR